MNLPKNGFLKENKCPYCDYRCTAAELMEDENQAPCVGDLTFCLMCCGASQFDENMNMIIFDINSIDDLIERNRIKGEQLKMELFWETHPDNLKIRGKYLNARDQKMPIL